VKKKVGNPLQALASAPARSKNMPSGNIHPLLAEDMTMITAWVVGLVLAAPPEPPAKAPPAGVAVANARAADKEEKAEVLAQASIPIGKPLKEPLNVARSAKDFLTVMSGGTPPPGVDFEKIEPMMQMNIGKMLKVDKFDFKKQMLIVIAPPKGGAEIVSVTKKDKKLVVNWKGGGTPGARIAAVDRFDGDVVFDPASADGK
jgi:hypothetical protein